MMKNESDGLFSASVVYAMSNDFIDKAKHATTSAASNGPVDRAQRPASTASGDRRVLPPVLPPDLNPSHPGLFAGAAPRQHPLIQVIDQPFNP